MKMSSSVKPARARRQKVQPALPLTTPADNEEMKLIENLQSMGERLEELTAEREGRQPQVGGRLVRQNQVAITGLDDILRRTANNPTTRHATDCVITTLYEMGLLKKHQVSSISEAVRGIGVSDNDIGSLLADAGLSGYAYTPNHRLLYDSEAGIDAPDRGVVLAIWDTCRADQGFCMSFFKSMRTDGSKRPPATYPSDDIPGYVGDGLNRGIEGHIVIAGKNKKGEPFIYDTQRVLHPGFNSMVQHTGVSGIYSYLEEYRTWGTRDGPSSTTGAETLSCKILVRTIDYTEMLRPPEMNAPDVAHVRTKMPLSDPLTLELQETEGQAATAKQPWRRYTPMVSQRHRVRGLSSLNPRAFALARGQIGVGQPMGWEYQGPPQAPQPGSEPPALFRNDDMPLIPSAHNVDGSIAGDPLNTDDMHVTPATPNQLQIVSSYFPPTDYAAAPEGASPEEQRINDFARPDAPGVRKPPWDGTGSWGGKGGASRRRRRSRRTRRIRRTARKSRKR
jgi:hypothetical protein